VSARNPAQKGEMPSSGKTAYLVVTAIGGDRPGIVDEFSKFVLERQCNIEDSRMAVLGGEFAIIVLIAGPSENVARVQEEVKDFGQKHEISVAAKPTLPHVARMPEGYVPYRLRGTGVDHPGIVQKFSHILHEAGANIESLDTRTYSAPVSGTPVFHFDMIVEVPARIAIASLRQRLLKQADAENLDLEVHPVVAGE
jgi:glycine cleavage system transcriptional repressor